MKLPTLPMRVRALAVAAVLAGAGAATQAVTPLADQPVFSTIAVPGNMALALSVEFPTAVSVAHTGATYDPTKSYLGYFDPEKCYLYNYSATEAQRYFYPVGLATQSHLHRQQQVERQLHELATMQTIDPFRWALTGGYRAVDTATTTISKGPRRRHQGSDTNFPLIPTLGNAAKIAHAAAPIDHTPGLSFAEEACTVWATRCASPAVRPTRWATRPTAYAYPRRPWTTRRCTSLACASRSATTPPAPADRDELQALSGRQLQARQG